MAPFGSTAEYSDFFDSLPPLEIRKPDLSTFFVDPVDLEAQEKAVLYCLALVDEAGEVVRAATEEDMKLLEGGSEQAQPQPQAAPAPKEEPEALSDTAFKELISRGPVCRHCGVTESPQWRRGPPAKPILCNACGTRYRRTGQLNHAAQNAANRKRATPSDCAREMVGEKARAMKQPRVVA